MSEKSYEEIFADFDEITNSYDRKNQYFDILYDSTSVTSITKTPSSEDFSVSTKKSGYVARTFIDIWHEYAFEQRDGLKSIKDKLPKAMNKGDNIATYEGWKINKEVKMKIDPASVPLEDKIKKIREIYNYVKSYDERIIQARIMYSETLTERIFFNNEGCQLRQVLPRARIAVIPVAKEGPVVDYDYLIKTGQLGFEIFDYFSNEKLEEVVKNSLEMLEAKAPPSGRTTIILDPKMAGLIAHESFGHGLEADQVLRDRSYLKEYLYKQVASEACTIYDNPSIENEISSYFFDDEGLRPGNNLLVEDGILKNFIYDRRTAEKFNATPQGNGRRESFRHPVNVRMTSTYFGSGDYELNEMISEIKEGVMLVHGSFGMEDPLGGGLQCTSKKAYLIENGEKTKILKQTALSGLVLDLLMNIDAVSKDIVKLDGGTCGKGSEDLVPVTSGGSYLRANNALISQG
ncbi:MAG: TldD/PmbA family protein [Candidatus Lokiarchaeota archaeon]|nr:TldD/PmbA family protein [Candidatus Lokiarchaeota archaeon]